MKKLFLILLLSIPLFGQDYDSPYTGAQIDSLLSQIGGIVEYDSLKDEDISATGGTTLLFNLNPRYEIFSILVEVDSAFDAGTILSIGYGTGSDTNYVATIYNANQAGRVYSKLQLLHSATSSLSLYIKKSKATTSGLVRISTTTKKYLWSDE